MALTLSTGGQGGVFTLRAGSFGGRFRASVTPVVPLLLDDYPNAAAAYSLRKLRTAYTGSAIRIRRSSDNTETDIGFVANGLDTTTLTTFCGAGNGFVTTWYDQSGNANDANQTTTANQPRIVSSGVVELEGSKPTLFWYNTTCGLNIVGRPLTGATTISFFSVANAQTSNAYEMLFTVGNSSSYINIRKNVGGTFMEYIFSNLSTATTNSVTVNSAIKLYNLIKNGLSYDYRINTSVDVQGTYPSNVATVDAQTMIGARLDGFSWQGTISEMIIYRTDQSANRTNINNNINTNYSIY
jgi:hypothetical protein